MEYRFPGFCHSIQPLYHSGIRSFYYTRMHLFYQQCFHTLNCFVTQPGFHSSLAIQLSITGDSIFISGVLNQSTAGDSTCLSVGVPPFHQRPSCGPSFIKWPPNLSKRQSPLLYMGYTMKCFHCRNSQLAIYLLVCFHTSSHVATIITLGSQPFY